MINVLHTVFSFLFHLFMLTALPKSNSVYGVSTSAITGAEQWSPYEDNGGTCIGVAGKDFVVMAGDTRLSTGYSIVSRDVAKGTVLSEKTVIMSAGMQADRFTFHKLLHARLAQFQFMHQQTMSTQSVAQMISGTLYSRRFFPYYTFNVVGGLDEEGKGAIYGYDAIGSFERMPYCVTGSGTKLCTPLLDNQVGFKTQPGNKRDLTLDETIDLVKDAFTCAGERDIYTGDYVDLYAVTSAGVQYERFNLKKD